MRQGYIYSESNCHNIFIYSCIVIVRSIEGNGTFLSFHCLTLMWWTKLKCVNYMPHICFEKCTFLLWYDFWQYIYNCDAAYYLNIMHSIVYILTWGHQRDQEQACRIALELQRSKTFFNFTFNIGFKLLAKIFYLICDSFHIIFNSSQKYIFSLCDELFMFWWKTVILYDNCTGVLWDAFY